MKFTADLHLHSKYSRAVSQEMVLPKMAQWAKYKGINVLATGDFTHPFWMERLKKELEETGNGLFRLKTNDKGLKEVYFLLSCEISSIYSQGGRARRIHNLFFFPSLESVAKFNMELVRRGANLRSDGRPIVGIPSGELAKMALSCDEKALIIPAHVWTPWFSVFGSFSGFDSIEECFGDMAKYIYGIETGLSSDPAMNWRISDLANRAILSFSDAHSLEKMGREATVFEGEEISYESIYEAISQSKIAFTIEFHPEEGKYHYTGHRECNVSLSPEETKQKGEICPVCHRGLTIGVMHRVQQLAAGDTKYEIRNTKDGVRWVYPQGNSWPPYVSLVPLLEILSQAVGAAVKTKKVMDIYNALISGLGSEFALLMRADLAQIAKIAGQRVAEGVQKVRRGDIVIKPGYDGLYGVVAIWSPDAQKVGISETAEQNQEQLNLFM